MRDVVPGTATYQEFPSPGAPYSVVFEDDGQTGYLYGVLHTAEGFRILDTLLIYEVTDAAAATSLTVDALWTPEGLRVLFKVDGVPQAAFDFGAERAYCRTGFPSPPSPGFSPQGHAWSDEVLEWFRGSAG